MEWVLEYLWEVKVTWSHTQKTIPWYRLGLYFKISDEHTHNLYLGVPPIPTTILGIKIQTSLIELIPSNFVYCLIEMPSREAVEPKAPCKLEILLQTAFAGNVFAN